MADFLVLAGIVVFCAAMLALTRGLGLAMSVVQILLLVLSCAVFGYLGVALFKAEWF